MHDPMGSKFGFPGGFGEGLKTNRVEEQSGVDSRGGGRILPSRTLVLNRQEVEQELPS